MNPEMFTDTKRRGTDSLGLGIDKFHAMLNQVRGVVIINLDEIRSKGSGIASSGTFAGIIEDALSENSLTSVRIGELRHTISEVIETLPGKESIVVSLYYFEDLDMREISDILGITESKVCQIHTKAILCLRSKLKGMTYR